MKKWNKALLMVLPATLSLSFQAFAGQWKSDMNGWWYQEEDGSYLTNGWYWLDGNGDGIAESYYFDKNGYLMREHGYVDGYEVDEHGAWIVNGKVQTKQVADFAGMNDAEVLFQIAAEKNSSLDQVDGTMEMVLSETAYGVTGIMSMKQNFKMRGIHSGNPQFVSDGAIGGLGVEIPLRAFYTDGFFYSESSSGKFQEPMAVEEALDQAYFIESYLLDSSDVNYAGAFTVRQEGENKILYLDLNSDVFREEIGLYDYEDTTYQIHTANMEFVINPEGHCTAA